LLFCRRSSADHSSVLPVPAGDFAWAAWAVAAVILEPASNDDGVSSGDRSSADLEVHDVCVNNAQAAPVAVASAITVVVTIVRHRKVRGRRQEQQHGENRDEALHGVLMRCRQLGCLASVLLFDQAPRSIRSDMLVAEMGK
jgi:hypothetical protein